MVPTIRAHKELASSSIYSCRAHKKGGIAATLLLRF
jgi:hypothetical protein